MRGIRFTFFSALVMSMAGYTAWKKACWVDVGSKSAVDSTRHRSWENQGKRGGDTELLAQCKMSQVALVKM